MIEAEPSNLALFWVSVIAVAIMIYVILDGFDLGIGVLFGVAKNEARRDAMITTISPFWDGNETWLVVIGASLFAAFPMAYSVFPAGILYPSVAFVVRVDLPWCRL
jgi:cytochrome d ubiquinol oxidase subunit II